MDSNIRARAVLKSKVTIFTKFVNELFIKFPTGKINDSVILEEIEQRLARFCLIITEFEDIQVKIEDTIIDETDLNTQLDQREAFEKGFFEVSARAKSLLAINKSVKQVQGFDESQTDTNNSANSCCMPSVRLPKMELPHFGGEVKDWLEYRDVFESVIHNNPAVPLVQKYQYLRSSLRGSAAQVISNVEFSQANYSVAWDLVCNRYNNPRILIQNHVKSLFNLDKIHEESAKLLRKMIDDVSKHLRALQTLGEATDSWDTLVIHLVTTRLDNVTLREWEKFRYSSNKVVLSELYDFLRKRADILESIENDKVHKPNKFTRSEPRPKAFVVSKTICPSCKQDHFFYNCPKFAKLNVNEKIIEAKRCRVCLNCLRSGHFVKDCKACSCKHCNGRHNSILHIFKQEPLQPSESVQSAAPSTSSNNELTVNSCASKVFNTSVVLLSTARVLAKGPTGQTRSARILIDSGSESSFITESLAYELRAVKSQVHIRVAGIGDVVSTIKAKTSINVASQDNNFNRQLTCYVVPQITSDLPAIKVNLDNLKLPNNIVLADDHFNVPNRIDILIGCDHAWDIFVGNHVKLTNKGPALVETKFGWVVSGPIPHESTKIVRCNFSKGVELEKQLTRFWEVEEISKAKPLSREEQRCESHFVITTVRNKEGRFVVKIPLKVDENKLGDSFDTAIRRFLNLERKFKHNLNFKNEYVKFINEYIMMGHMSKVSHDSSSLQVQYYMPHHGVIKEDSTTTKLRVVFDASCFTTSGISFNDIQMVGPTIQPDLVTTLIRYRGYEYAVIADVEKMYRMCLVDESQRRLQRIVWRDDPNKPICVFELNTITYGTASAPFLAIRCLHQIGIDCQAELPGLAKVIQNHFYVDDLLTGGDSVQEVVSLVTGVSDQLLKAGFKLRKWVSNNEKILREINGELGNNQVDFGLNEHTKTLGFMWNSKADCYSFKIGDYTGKESSKRSVLSEIAQVFDPLGLLSPCIISAKIFMQELWAAKLSWDDQLPVSLQHKWSNFRNELSYLNQIRIPRKVVCSNPVYAEIHGFADASTRAYGACVYLKSLDKNHETTIRLVTAKSKVAPSKEQTIPRLELVAAVLLVQLVEKVKSSLSTSISKIFYWSDSSIVLSWILTSPSLLNVFVSHRVARIQEKTQDNEWRHVPTYDNPADYISRGVDPQTLSHLKMYWNGPEWLQGTEENWPQFSITSTGLPEMRVKMAVVKHPWFSEFSDLTRAERTLAYWLRFKVNCRAKKSGQSLTSGPLTFQEINQATKVLIIFVQQELFAAETLIFKGESKDILARHLAKLNPFIDEKGIIRVGGRLSNSNFSHDKKFPILLSDHWFTLRLFEREHKRLLHAGPQHLLASIRSTYWPLNGRKLARKVVHQCVTCFRCKPTSVQPKMGSLPADRVKPSPPFYVTGVDYAGPFTLKDKRGRGCKTFKAYVSVFVCFAVKAVHLELVTDLTSESFLAALRRFVARRGKPFQMWSDNGTNFVGANRELKDLAQFLKNDENRIKSNIENFGIKWSFIPAHAPHFGGLWEAGVKAMKFHLKRVIGNEILTFEQFNTLLTQIESTLNSRPLSPMSSDPSDLKPLTPAHFLIGREFTSVADPNVLEIPQNRLSHFQQVQKMHQRFWSRWSLEYVSELQQRIKWHKSQGSLKVDDIVLIKEDDLPPQRWSLGRIIQIYPGTDGISRVASLRTSKGEIKRAFSKICPLPIKNNVSDCRETKGK